MTLDSEFTDFQQELDDMKNDADTKAALDRALKRLVKAQTKKVELVKAVYQAARDAAEAMPFPDAAKPAKDRRKRDAETAIVLLSDFQLGKITPSYSSEVCAERIERLAAKVREITDIQRSHHPVKACRVYLLGDIVEGELIFPGQSHLIDASLFHQVMIDGPRILGGFVQSMLEHFEEVKVVGVIGNHGYLGGRSRREMHPESNADAMAYEATRQRFSDPRLTWNPTITPGERAWYAVDEVGSKRWFLFHGDQVKGGALGFPWYGFGKKLGGWSNLYGFDYAASGHFHTPVRGLYGAGSIVHWGNGSTESDNTYAAENMAAASQPNQWLLFQSDERVTAEYNLDLS